MTEKTNWNDLSWQSPLGNAANDRTSRARLHATGRPRWRVTLPHHHVAGISVGADGLCLVSSGSGITALDGPTVRWSVDTSAAWSPLPLDDGLFVTGETGGLVLREQRTGRTVHTIPELQLRSDPTMLPNGLLAFLAWRDDRTVLRATARDGRSAWQHELASWSLGRPLVQPNHVVIADGAVLRAFSGSGNPAWTIDLHQLAHESATVEVEGPLVGLSGDRILVAVRTPAKVGYALVDTRQGTVRALPAHLPPRPLAIPLSEGGRELLAVPGWPEKDDYNQLRPTVTVVDIATGANMFQHAVPTAPHGMVAGSTGLVAVAGSPTPERWSTYHGPGFDLADDCYVLFLDHTGVRGEWKPGRPVTGPLAVGTDGDLLVPVSGELVSLE